jgi:hypothetical protein
MRGGRPAAAGSPAAGDWTSPAGRYFAALYSAFAEARAGTTAIDYALGVGPSSVRLSFAGGALAPALIPALSNVVAATPVEPDATVFIFDSASTGVEVPPFPWLPRQVRERGEVEGHSDERFRTIHQGDALSVFDVERRTGIFWGSSIDRLSWWERAEPLRASLHWALNGEDRCLVHAAGVADEDGVILLAGSGGSGKTTTALACVRDGLGFVGDNYVLVSLGRTPVAYALYRNAKLRPRTLDLLPELAAAVTSFDVERDEKFIVDVGRWRSGQLAGGLPIKAVVVTRVTGGETTLEPASPVEALLALAPTTIYQLPRNGGALGPMAELVRRAPSFTLEVGDDLATSPAVIRDLLRRAVA